MAEKLSINIDLRDSAYVKQKTTPVHNGKAISKSKVTPIEFIYRYDRMFAVSLVLIVIIIAIYFVVTAIFSTSDHLLDKKQLTTPLEQAIETPVEAAVEAPMEAVVEAPVETIVTAPVEAVVEAPVEAVVEAPVETIVTASVEAVVEAPVEMIVKAPAEEDLPLHKELDNHFIQNFSAKLSRVLLASNIYKKEPVNPLSYQIIGQPDRAEKVYLFTQLDNSIGKMIEHQWWHQGKMVISKKFTALGNRWRCYSSKNLDKFQQGEWKLNVVDQKGKILSIVNFHYQIN